MIRIVSFDYKRMIQTLKRLHKRTHFSYVFLIKDVFSCMKKHGAGYVDYELFEMYNMDESIRETVVTRGRNNTLIRTFNDPKYKYLFLDKAEFNLRFKQYLKREFLILEDEKTFYEFIKDKNEIIAKPSRGSCGKGIEKINLQQEKNVYEYLKKKQLNLVEEVICQHPKMNLLCETSVNTIRVITIHKKNKTSIVVAYLRIGNGKVVDNFNSGGMVVPVDIKTGMIYDVAVDKEGHTYENHPLTKTPIVNFEIPEWNHVLALVKEASNIVPEIGLVGWDIAISKKGSLIVEGNEFPGHDIYQLPPHRKDGEGIYPKFLEVMKEK